MTTPLTTSAFTCASWCTHHERAQEDPTDAGVCTSGAPTTVSAYRNVVDVQLIRDREHTGVLIAPRFDLGVADFDAEQARQLAAVLLTAADRLDQSDPPTVRRDVAAVDADVRVRESL